MADSNKNDSSVEFIGGNKYCRLRSHHHKAQAIIKENGGSFRGSFWVVAGGAEAASGDLIKRIREAATLDDKVQLASRVVMDADKASSLKVGEDHDFGPGVGVKPVLWVGRSFEGRDASFDKRFSEQGLVGKEVAYVYHDNPPKEALRGKPAARTVEDQKRIAADASQRAASREVVEADALASVRMGEPFDFGGDVGVKPVLWVSAAFEARDAAHEPRFSERGLVGKQVAYVYHSSPPIKPLEKAAETDPAAAKALSIVKSGGVSAPKAEAPKAEAPKAEAPKAEAPKAEAPKAEAPKAEAPKAEAPKAEAPKAEAPKAEAPKAEAPKAEAPKAEAPKAEAPKAEAPKAEAPKAEAPKAEAPKAEAPKAEAPKAEAPKAEAPKAEAPKAEDVGNATVSEAGALGMEDFAALGDLEDEIAAAAPVEKIENDDFSALEDLAGGLDDVGGL